MARQSTTYNKITAKIIFSMLFLTLVSSIVYSQYVKEEVILNLAKVDARKTSKLVFEAMYSAMQKGWNKDEISEIITRLNKVDERLEISIYRGEKVSAIYGEIEKDKKARTNDLNIRNAFVGKETLDIENVEIIKYYFPVIANDKCKTCHTNAKEGDVLGVININYPITDLKVSLNDIINLFLLFIISFTVVMFTLLFINFQ
jgi:c-di-GMP phosphodiesterase